MKTRYQDIPDYVTKDGSTIRELMHPDHHDVSHQSLAEARIPVGHHTKLHQHSTSEELYHVTAGRGLMTLGAEQFEVLAGDTVCIKPNTPHCIENTGEDELVMLCCCSPAYSHDDTVV